MNILQFLIICLTLGFCVTFIFLVFCINEALKQQVDGEIRLALDIANVFAFMRVTMVFYILMLRSDILGTLILTPLTILIHYEDAWENIVPEVSEALTGTISFKEE